MKSFVAFLFVFGCAVNVCCGIPPPGCSTPPPRIAPGGIVDAQGKYVQGSVLIWVQISQSASCHVSQCGQQLLREWEQASRLFDQYMTCNNLCKAYEQFYVALAKFRAVCDEIEDNDVLRLRFQTTYTEFAGVLKNGLSGDLNLVDISNYMAYAHGPFSSAIREVNDNTFKCCVRPRTYA